MVSSSNSNMNTHFKNKAIDYCLDIIKREDVKNELKQLFKPVIQLILQEIYPYIYLYFEFLKLPGNPRCGLLSYTLSIEPIVFLLL